MSFYDPHWMFDSEADAERAFPDKEVVQCEICSRWSAYEDEQDGQITGPHICPETDKYKPNVIVDICFGCNEACDCKKEEE